MTFTPTIKTITIAFLLNIVFLTGWATVKGPIVIDVIGYDAPTHSVYFTRTDWGECDCETDLYIYRTDKDSLIVKKKWASRALFRLKQDRVIEMNGLSHLTRLQTAALPPFVSLQWLPEVSYYSQVIEAETVSFPFNIRVFNKNYDFFLCSKDKGDPQVADYLIDSHSGLVLIIYQGDCYEGNLNEALIYYSTKNGKAFSRELSPHAVNPLKYLEIKKPEPSDTSQIK